MSINVVELFAGVGGFRVGLESASDKYKFVWANQWEPSRKNQDAYNCYCNHFGNENHSNENIHDVVKAYLPNHDLLVGGFPCQDYSVASTGAKGIQGKKGVLWWDIQSIIETKRPKFVLLENVDRLLKSPASQRGRDFAIILACFKELGYSVEWRVINAAEYGFAQRRRRVFIFAYRNDTDFAQKTKSFESDELLNKSGFFQSLFPTIKKDSKKHIPNTVEFEFDDLLDVSEHFSMKFYNSGIMT
ncbi:MAG: DNA (cytosine-5-)-methyltransferase, partial [Acidaminobacteraceae bacterium]